MTLAQTIADCCDGIALFSRSLDRAIAHEGFATQDSYSSIELDVAVRRLRETADKIEQQRERLAGNEPAILSLVAAE